MDQDRLLTFSQGHRSAERTKFAVTAGLTLFLFCLWLTVVVVGALGILFAIIVGVGGGALSYHFIRFQPRGPGKVRVQLKSGDWMDLGASHFLCKWNGDAAPLGIQEFQLWLTRHGNLVMKRPASGTVIMPQVARNVQYEYVELLPEEAVSFMIEHGGSKEARKLLPEEYGIHRAEEAGLGDER